MDIVEKYELISKIGYASAIIFLIVAVILFFLFRITKVFGYLTGITRKKAIRNIRIKNEKEANDVITEKISLENPIRQSRSNMTDTSKITTVELGGETETVLLNQDGAELFWIVKDITFIHTNVRI